MAIVTVSHQLGSGGAEIAREVARDLGYRCVGADVLAEAAHQHGLAEERLSRLGEAKPPFLERLAAETRTYIAVMQSAVLDAALQDDVVLIGRGGQWLLRGIPHALRVRVIAPFDLRVRRLAEALATQGGRRPGLRVAHEAVADLVRRDDADKIGRMRYLCDQHLDNPELYRVVMNVDHDDLDGPARRSSFSRDTRRAPPRRVAGSVSSIARSPRGCGWRS